MQSARPLAKDMKSSTIVSVKEYSLTTLQVVLTASEFDAMAVHQATEMPALSLPNGCLNLSPEVETSIVLLCIKLTIFKILVLYSIVVYYTVPCILPDMYSIYVLVNRLLLL